MDPCKFVVFLAIAVTYVVAAPGMTDEIARLPAYNPPALDSSLPLERVKKDVANPIDSAAIPASDKVQNVDDALSQPLYEGQSQESRVKKQIFYNGFAYSYPTYPIVSPYSYQYHRSYPYAYSASYYPYVYEPTWIF